MTINELLEWPKVLAAVILLLGIASAMYGKERSPLSLGGMAIPIAMFTGVGFWREALDDWTVFVPLIGALALFAIGLSRPKDKDTWWHFGAMGAALFGKLLIWGAITVGPVIWAFLKGDVEIKFYGWMFTLLIGVALGVTFTRSQRVKGWIAKIRDQNTEEAPATT